MSDVLRTATGAPVGTPALPERAAPVPGDPGRAASAPGDRERAAPVPGGWLPRGEAGAP